MPFSSLPGARRRLSRAHVLTYVVGSSIWLVGTVVLVIADLMAPTPLTRGLRLAVTALWLALWAALLVFDRRARRLADETARLQELMASLSEARRRVLADEDPRQAVVQAVLEVARARVAVLSEPRDGDLVGTASAGTTLPDLRLPLDQPSVAGGVLRSGRPLSVRNIADEADAARTVVRRMEELVGARLHSIAYVPVVSHGRSLGVLSAAFDEVDPRAADAAVPLLELLAAEVAVTIERERLVEELRVIASTDALTGIPNRRAWQEALRSLPRRGGVLLLDIDFFKRVNDTWGHDTGDGVLRAFADVLRETVRAEDLCARVGGEEFAVLLGDGADPAALVERLRVRWQARVEELGRGPLTFSAGAAMRLPRESLADLQRRSDRALYAAKAGGRDRLVLAPADGPDGLTPRAPATGGARPAGPSAPPSPPR